MKAYLAILVAAVMFACAIAGHHDNGLGYGSYDLLNGGWAKGIGSFGGCGDHGAGFRGCGWGWGHGGHHGGNGGGFEGGFGGGFGGF